MSMNDFAHHIIAVANENSLKVTNLQLQKVMYFSLKEALQKNLFDRKQLTELYDRPFLVWRYGPVERDIYETYKVYGADPITESQNPYSEYKFLDSFIVTELKKDPFELVNESHQEEYWEKHEKDIHGWRSNVEYSLDNVQFGK